MASILSHCVKRYMSSKGKLMGPSGVTGAHDGGFKIYRNISFVALPIIAVLAINCYMLEQEHKEHRPEFIKYEYLRIRTKRFPWGDGTKSLFHNPHTNPLPDGYEDEL